MSVNANSKGTATLPPDGSRSGGDADLGWEMTSILEDATITISTNGTNSFGSTAPSLLYRDTLDTYTEGDAISTSANFEGVATV